MHHIAIAVLTTSDGHPTASSCGEAPCEASYLNAHGDRAASWHGHDSWGYKRRQHIVMGSLRHGRHLTTLRCGAPSEAIRLGRQGGKEPGSASILLVVMRARWSRRGEDGSGRSLAKAGQTGAAWGLLWLEWLEVPWCASADSRASCGDAMPGDQTSQSPPACRLPNSEC